MWRSSSDARQPEPPQQLPRLPRMLLPLGPLGQVLLVPTPLQPKAPMHWPEAGSMGMTDRRVLVKSDLAPLVEELEVGVEPGLHGPVMVAWTTMVTPNTRVASATRVSSPLTALCALVACQLRADAPKPLAAVLQLAGQESLMIARKESLGAVASLRHGVAAEWMARSVRMMRVTTVARMAKVGVVPIERDVIEIVVKVRSRVTMRVAGKQGTGPASPDVTVVARLEQTRTMHLRVMTVEEEAGARVDMEAGVGRRAVRAVLFSVAVATAGVMRVVRTLWK